MNPELPLSSIKEALQVKGDHLIISGPCSAETRDQVVNTCQQVADTGKVHTLRAGIWKPRTRPNSFEGVGEEGLKWLAEAKETTGLPITTEVAKGEHVELCLKYGVDVLWIGARTTVNPFSVQEIADALKGIDIPVMVKNPINPDLQLWIGALERVSHAGITKLAAIHRGFSSHAQTPFRNEPMWQLPVQLKTMLPEIEIICDPSHIAGSRDIIPLIAQKALDLDMDGLMIESHIQPKLALSDAKQQVKPNALDRILSELVFRNPNTVNADFKNHLEDLRGMIDEIDENIIQQFATRMNIAEQIGLYKKDNAVTILQVNRWSEIIQDRITMGKALGLTDKFINKLLNIIHEESIERQNRVMNAEQFAEKVEKK